ncbi:hypothetical protein [Fodinicola feengrottensis]|uniref:Lipoprotein n=1 Tax=Fodinicola feengrottensis TaxID=435914 RepID=A0ABN2FRK7_9ACTN|nr:hypothetical protein [Fodinicola feengrottensis]
MKHRHWLLAASLAAVAMTSACGAGTSVPQVASANGSSAPAASPSAADPHAQAVKFTQCLRSHGIKIDDPKGDSGGLPRLPAGQDPGKMQAALQACQQYAPQGNVGKPATAADLAKARKWVACMRDHGVKNMPDPNPQGAIPEPSNVDKGTYQAAQKACQSIFGSDSGGR